MKLLHTADWHIGQLFHEYERAYEHQQFLKWLVNTLQQEQIDVLLISGDVFDLSNPAAASVRMFYTFLNQAIHNNPQLQIIITAGNHDSAARLESPKPLLESSDIHIIGLVEKDEHGNFNYDKLTIPLKDKNGETKAWCMAVPFLRMGDYPAVAAENPYTEGVTAFYRQAYASALGKKQPGQAIIAMGHLHARQALDRHKAQHGQTQQAITRSATQRDETLQELQRLAVAIQELHSNITRWLGAYNAKHTPALTRAGLETLLTLSIDWIAAERKALQQPNDALLQAQTLLNRHNTALEKHREQALSDKTMEAVTGLLTAARLTLGETNREDAETKLRLRQDDDNRQKAGALLQQIAAKENTVNNWAMLNRVIGSADGKKFRQVAQEYTLDVLPGYTNVQLGMLSKRYVLQRIPQSLGLQVADRDMGNEVRTVNSLSGGESFLVSLALALGLASLSSGRMQVESLFIDEGFGSLDPNTLNVAMDALERLHNQGRKVGVISHVQEMTERIPVQISVRKLNGAKSKVEVIGL